VLEQSGEPELRTKRIGVGTHVRGENELLVSPNQVGEGIPIDRHAARISPTARFGHRWPLWAGGLVPAGQVAEVDRTVGSIAPAAIRDRGAWCSATGQRLVGNERTGEITPRGDPAGWAV
jgi:hypothetical protein